MPDRRVVHRLFYPNAREGQDPKRVRPLLRAGAFITPAGVYLKFLEPGHSLSPNELRMLARWLYSLSHETQDLADSGLIDEDHGYDVIEGKMIPLRGEDAKSRIEGITE